MGHPNDNNSYGRPPFRNNGAANRGRGPKEPAKPSPEKLFFEALVGKRVRVERRGNKVDIFGIMRWHTEHSMGVELADNLTGSVALVMKGDVSTVTEWAK